MDFHAGFFGDVDHGLIRRQTMHVKCIDICIAAMNGGALEQLRSYTQASRGFRHRHAEFRDAVLCGRTMNFRQRIACSKRQMTGPYQLELAVIYPEYGIAYEVD